MSRIAPRAGLFCEQLLSIRDASVIIAIEVDVGGGANHHAGAEANAKLRSPQRGGGIGTCVICGHSARLPKLLALLAPRPYRNLRKKTPLGMHWRTFERLTAEHDAFVAESLAGMAQHIRALKKSIRGLD